MKDVATEVGNVARGKDVENGSKAGSGNIEPDDGRERLLLADRGLALR
ncbi:MAG: hypothetical protein QOJ62_477 [Actinomycetota bacterium]|nr:hypothetical protein [Actinomycetota bacterium]